jgi:hypothetical protein
MLELLGTSSNGSPELSCTILVLTAVHFSSHVSSGKQTDAWVGDGLYRNKILGVGEGLNDGVLFSL